MRYVRIFLISLAAVALLGVAGWFFAVWSAQKAFESAAQGGGLKELSDVAKAAIGATLARSESDLELVDATKPVGAFEFYEKNPQQLQRDKMYFETWYSSLAIAVSSLENGHQVNEWQSSTKLQWIPIKHKMDSWGYVFCVKANGRQAIVVSSGPDAASSPDCGTLKLTTNEWPRCLVVG